jgi:hypothetical protein
MTTHRLNKKTKKTLPSLTYDAIKEEQKLSYIHIDLETGGEATGIIQMSAISHNLECHLREQSTLHTRC